MADAKTWKHGVCGCCDSGFMFFCKDMYCCACCTLGKVWAAYEMPGGFLVGCCCGGGLICHIMLRSKVASAEGINDGINTFLCPCCCAGCSMWQIIQEAKDAGKLGGAGAPAETEMVR
mmetsp:Transcript_144180/g.350040  ORF Transcript_144180/g.350040 Transcript_144180/m.350040 type:complete len:118 (+) Transcript_144180:64-417(+)